MHICKSVDEAVALIRSFSGKTEDFDLCIDEPLMDPVGLNVAIIADAALAKGWWPLDVERHNGHRRFRYRNASD